MRGNAASHAMIAPGNLPDVLALLADEPGVWTPIAGGTELMVAHAAGRLTASKLVSLWNVPELRLVERRGDSFVIGAGTTFRDLRQHADVAQHFPLLHAASAWIGAIANQSRATIGGNLVNGSPAADSSPALLAYDAEIELVSVRGTRRILYAQFHTGYKSNAMTADELLFAVYLPIRFARHRQYIRKVGTRRAMAISKVALAVTALVEGEIIREIHIGAASLAPFPTRLYKTEEALHGRVVHSGEIREDARRALLNEAHPIDDIRSNAEYRKQVAANLLEEFLRQISQPETRP